VHRYREDDFTPYAFRTDDYGRTWTRLTDGTNGIPVGHFVRVVREDPVRKGLLYAGTERGLYVSFDDGTRWESLQRNLPVTQVSDLVVKGSDLVVATHGRAFWILDDVSPLRQEAEAAPHLFRPRAAHRVRGSSAERPRAGRNPPNGAILYFSLPDLPPEEVALSILDASGAALRRFSPEVHAGWNRFVWDLRHAPAESAREGPLGEAIPGPNVSPGSYQVRLEVSGKSLLQPLEVRKDPRLATTDDDFRAQETMALALRDRIDEIYRAVAEIQELRARMGDLEELAEIEETLVQTKMRLPIEVIDHGPRLDLSYVDLYQVVTGADARPTDGARERFDDLEKELERALSRLREIASREPGDNP
jgi:hypothetical protein